MIDFRRFALLECLFFLICLGLGYPTLNRYDRQHRDPDTVRYREMVIDGSKSVSQHFAHRVLIPYAAHLFYKMTENRMGSWDAGYFGLLIVNAFFISGAAALLVVIASKVTADANVGLLTGTLYLLNFAVPNLFLIGFVDSGEAFFLTVLVWAALRGRWWIVPFAMVLGSLSKETFLPFATTFCATWAIVDATGSRAFKMLLTGLGLVLGFLALLLAFKFTTGSMLTFATDGDLGRSNLKVAFAALTHHDFWFAFAYLVPLGMFGLKKMPRAWKYSTATTATLAFVLVVYHNGPVDAGPAFVRPAYSITGPLLTCSMASFIFRKLV
jgi:uncharacterized membrane protein